MCLELGFLQPLRHGKELATDLSLMTNIRAAGVAGVAGVAYETQGR